MPDLYLHPSVTSYITDQSQVFQTAAGVTTLFCPLISQKGRDNVLQVVDGPSDDDFVDKHGDPDSSKYGQAQLNVLEWIKAGGTVVTMRVLPEDALYAHAIIDLQTKDVDIKKWQFFGMDIQKVVQSAGNYYFSVIEEDGNELILITAEKLQEWYDGTDTGSGGIYLDIPIYDDDEAIIRLNGGYGTGVFGSGPYSTTPTKVAEVDESRVLIRSRTKRVVGGAASESAILAYAESIDGDLIIADGFMHHAVGYFRADGRGAEYYNELEFKLTANDALDDTYQFRVFDLEVYHQKDGVNVVVEGPYQVAFDETALDRSGESMFISNVLERYGKGTTFVLIDDGYEALCEELNATTDPALQDPFFLSERNLYSGVTDIHGLNVLSSGQTTLSMDVSPNDDKAYVEEPNLLYPGGPIVAAGVDALEIGSVINVTTGRIEFVAPIFTDELKAVTHVWEDATTVLAIGAVAVPTDIVKLTLASMTNNLGRGVFAVGDCLLEVNDGVNDSIVENSITAIDLTAMTVTLGTVLPIDAGYTINLKQVKYEAGDVITESALPEFSEANLIKRSLDGVTYMTPTDADVAATALFISVTAAQAATFVVGGSVELEVFQNGVDSVMVDAEIVEIDEIDAVDSYLKLADAVDIPAGAVSVFTPGIKVVQTMNADSDGSSDVNFDESVPLSGGSVGSLMTANGLIDTTVRDQLLVQAYTGAINEEILQKKLWPIDMVLDANYNKSVKDACNDFVATLRQDCVFCADLGFTANPQQALDMRATLGYSTFFTAMFSQDASVFDEYIGRNVKVTVPFFIAGKVPLNDKNNGLHWPFVGPRRGVISGFENLSWNPTDQWQERLYRKQVNYVKKDPRRTMLYGQLTSQTVTSALSDLNHVRALLRMQREVEEMMEDYNFEFISDATLGTMNYNLNNYLAKWRDNGACSSISGQVYSSDYDRKQKTARVRIEMVFTAVLERVIINFVVK